MLSEKQTTKMESDMQEVYGGGECWRLGKGSKSRRSLESWTAIQSDIYQRRERHKKHQRGGASNLRGAKRVSWPGWCRVMSLVAHSLRQWWRAATHMGRGWPPSGEAKSWRLFVTAFLWPPLGASPRERRTQQLQLLLQQYLHRQLWGSSSHWMAPCDLGSKCMSRAAGLLPSSLHSWNVGGFLLPLISVCLFLYLASQLFSGWYEWWQVVSSFLDGPWMTKGPIFTVPLALPPLPKHWI